MASTAVSSAVSYARENQKRFLDELKDLLRIPSVSTAEEHKDDVRKAAEVVAADLKRIGFEHVEIIPTKGHPLVYADWLHAAGKPTGAVLCALRRAARRAAGRVASLRRSSRPSATRTSTRAAPWTTKASSGCSSRPSSRCSRAATASCPSMFACSSRAKKKWAARASRSTSRPMRPRKS